MTNHIANLLNIRDKPRKGICGQREVWEKELEEAAARILELESALAVTQERGEAHTLKP